MGSRLPLMTYRTSFIRIKPWPGVKFVTRPPASAKPSQAEAELCSDSGSRNCSVSPQRFCLPLDTSAAKPSPIGVEGVMGYAHAACEMCDSTQTTAPEPSAVERMPGYLGALFCLFVAVAVIGSAGMAALLSGFVSRLGGGWPC